VAIQLIRGGIQRILPRQRCTTSPTAEVFTTKAPSSSCLSASRPSSPQFAEVSLRTPTSASGPQHLTRGRLKVGLFYFWWGVYCLDFSSLEILFGRQFFFLAEGSFLSSLPFFFSFFGYVYLIVALVPFVFGFSVHLLGYHCPLSIWHNCPLSYGCAIFECGGVLVSTRSTLTTLVTLVLSSRSTIPLAIGTMGH
jgi:hypothetical protein